MIYVDFERDQDGHPRYAVPQDDSEVVRHAQPLDDRARAQILEQRIARMERDPVAVSARERRIALERGNVVDIAYRRR